MDVKKLKKVHPIHEKWKPKWEFFIAAYEGTEALLDYGVLERNERESKDNHRARLREAYGFGYSTDVVDTVCRYLFEKDASRELGKLADDPLWQRFVDDCDLMGTDFDVFLTEQQTYASAYGHVGILIDKASAGADTLEAERDGGIYPYLSVYHPQFILDWNYGRDHAGRPYLAFLKLLDEEGRYRLWWPDKWEIWEIQDNEPCMIAGGPNSLGEIPFVWLFNIKSRYRNLGISDIRGIARIDASIIRNLSHGEEIIKYSAFPMMRKPLKRVGDEVEDIVGVTGVLEFDPQDGDNGKPDWLEARCKEPVEAILLWLERKVDEIYRQVKGVGTRATDSRQARSAEALKREFQQLNARLVQKSRNAEECEKGIVYFWRRWQGATKGDALKGVAISHPRKFAVEDLLSDLEAALTAKTIVRSETFHRQIEKKVVRMALPNQEDGVYAEIDADIDKRTASISSAPTGSMSTGGRHERNI